MTETRKPRSASIVCVVDRSTIFPDVIILRWCGEKNQRLGAIAFRLAFDAALRKVGARPGSRVRVRVEVLP